MAKHKKSDLVNHLADKLALSKRQAEDAVDAMLDYVTSLLRNGDELAFTGFGTFLTKQRKGRMGINPKNPSEKIQIPASTVPRFRPGKSLKEAVNK